MFKQIIYILFLFVVLFSVGCGVKIKKANSAALVQQTVKHTDKCNILNTFLNSEPTLNQLRNKIESLNLNQPFHHAQNSAYSWTKWKLSDECSLTIYNPDTRAELRDKERKVLKILKIKTSTR